MPFIKIYPLPETEGTRLEDFGKGNPARCMAERRFSAPEWWLNVDHIVAFEECPLYLICSSETDALVNGIRIRLVTGELMVIPDDPQDGERSFLDALRRACQGEIPEMGYSRYLLELERSGLI